METLMNWGDVFVTSFSDVWEKFVEILPNIIGAIIIFIIANSEALKVLLLSRRSKEPLRPWAASCPIHRKNMALSGSQAVHLPFRRRYYTVNSFTIVKELTV